MGVLLVLEVEGEGATELRCYQRKTAPCGQVDPLVG